MFQMFNLNVAKVNMRCCICCNGNINMLQAYVSYVSDVSFKCFIWMFRKLIWYCTYRIGYTRMFQTHILSVFKRMFHLDVSKIDRMLHMLQ
jgi:hypothetical protein